MKTVARKPHKSRSTTQRSGFFTAASSPGFFSPVMRKASSQVTIQAKPTVSKPTDPLERHADRTAEEVMRAPAGPVQGSAAPVPPIVQRFGEGTPTVAADALAEIQHSTTGGRALDPAARSFLEPRLGADLADVRVHADESAASLSNHLSARAFTYQNHVFFGRDQYQPGSIDGRRLLAHELTHTIQQGATVQRKAGAGAPEIQLDTGPPRAEVARVSAASPTPAVQRLGMQKVLDYFADKAGYIPGFRMLTLVIGFNPINMRSADRTAANFLRALIELVPGGALITRALDAHGVINKAAGWVEQRVAALGDLGGAIVDGLRRFIDSLGWSDIVSPGDVWDRAKRILTDPIGRLISFGAGVVGDLLDLVRQAILRPLAALAEGTRGYDLLKAILGQDPITGDPYPRTAETLIGGFMKLIGQEEVWQNLQRGKAVQRAWAWFQGALSGLMAFVTSIPGRIVSTLRSLNFSDVVTVVGAFQKVGAAFLDLATRFGSWALNQVLSLLEILVSVVAPKVMPYIAKARAAFETIVRNPVGFVGNLVRAGRLGFEKFAGNILEHLKTALIKWLMGPLAAAGVYIPKSFSLLEIVKLVLSVLGLTWQNIRSKLVKIIPEPVLQVLEKTAGVLVTLVSDGPAAAWEQIKAELAELKDQLIGQVTQMVQAEIVKAAVKKLAMLLNPAGAVVQAILAIWDTVSFFIEKINQIGAVVAAFIDSISAIAAGQVENAAKKVEQTMANTLVVVIGFLAKFAGLGGIPEKLVGIVKKIRAPIDKGLDKIVAWLGKLIGKAKEAVKKLVEWWRKKVPVTGGDEPHTLTFQGERAAASLVVQTAPLRPVVFMTKAAQDAGLKDTESAGPIATTKKLATTVDDLQTKLKAFDDPKRRAASGKQADKADAAIKELDAALTALADHIGATLKEETWKKVGDPQVTKVKISRGKFTYDMKAKIALEEKRIRPGSTNLRKDASGEQVNVRKGWARRHVVSAYDVGKHCMDVLNAKGVTVSKAKLLLEQRSSIADARVEVRSRTVAAIRTAAVDRYTTFFGYAKNIFLGNSRENSSIQEFLDKGHPELAGKKFWEHVARIKREWALDSTFKASGEDE